MNTNYTHTWADGNDYPITQTTGAREQYNIIKVPVDAVLDYYTQQHINGNLHNIASSTRDPKRMELIDCVINEREVDYTMFRWNVVMIAMPNARAKTEKVYNAPDASEASLIATVLSGGETKFQAALAECTKRGITFTVKQIAAASKRGRDLTLTT